MTRSRPAFLVRAATEADVPLLAGIYRAAIRGAGRCCYSRARVDAWASFADDRQAFARWINGALTLVALDTGGEPAGFGGLETPPRISALFTAPQHMRRGVASTLLAALLARAGARGDTGIVTQASELSRPLFEKFGFIVDHVEETSFKDVAFSRYVMKRALP